MVFHLPDDSHHAWNEPGARSTSLLQILVSTPLLDNTKYSVCVLLCTSQHVAEFLLQAFSGRGTDKWEARRKQSNWTTTDAELGPQCCGSASSFDLFEMWWLKPIISVCAG